MAEPGREGVLGGRRGRRPARGRAVGPLAPGGPRPDPLGDRPRRAVADRLRASREAAGALAPKTDVTRFTWSSARVGRRSPRLPRQRRSPGLTARIPRGLRQFAPGPSVAGAGRCRIPLQAVQMLKRRTRPLAGATAAPPGRARRGDPRAAGRHGPQILAAARRYAATPEDAYQRGLEILLTKAPTTREGELVPWLKTVIIRPMSPIDPTNLRCARREPWA